MCGSTTGSSFISCSGRPTHDYLPCELTQDYRPCHHEGRHWPSYFRCLKPIIGASNGTQGYRMPKSQKQVQQDMPIEERQNPAAQKQNCNGPSKGYCGCSDKRLLRSPSGCHRRTEIFLPLHSTLVACAQARLEEVGGKKLSSK